MLRENLAQTNKPLVLATLIEREQALPLEAIQVICAWCGQDMGQKIGRVSDAMRGVPTHGICSSCQQALCSQRPSFSHKSQ